MTAQLATTALVPIDPATPLGILVAAVLALLTLAMSVAAYRVVRGPDLPDRVVGLDLLGLFVAAAVCVLAISTGRRSLLVVPIFLGLILFLGTAAFAFYLEIRTRGVETLSVYEADDDAEDDPNPDPRRGVRP